MERLTIDEVIEHCERTVERTENIVRLQGLNPQEETLSKNYWEHKQTAEWLKELKEYKQLEEQGLIHRTRVAIGQTVYTNFAMKGWYLREKDRPYEAKVVFIGLNDSEEFGGGFFNIAYEKLGCMMQFRFSDIEKSVFLTREEAKAALERLGDE